MSALPAPPKFPDDGFPSRPTPLRRADDDADDLGDGLPDDDDVDTISCGRKHKEWHKSSQGFARCRKSGSVIQNRYRFEDLSCRALLPSFG